MRWKPSVTLVLFLSLNHRKCSHSRVRSAQCRLHVSAAESNHIRAVSKPHSTASLLIICGPWASTPWFRVLVFLFVIAPGWAYAACRSREWVRLGYCVTVTFQHGLICHRTITFTACIVMAGLAGILESCGLCLWVWILVAILCSCWALKPRQRRVGASLIRAGVTVPDTHTHHTHTHWGHTTAVSSWHAAQS